MMKRKTMKRHRQLLYLNDLTEIIFPRIYFTSNGKKVKCLTYIELVVKKFLKFLLGVNKSTSTLAILGECGQIPFFLQGFQNLLKFWYRITYLPENMLVNMA